MSEDGGFIIGTSGNIIIKTDQDISILSPPLPASFILRSILLSF
jgi:hypothetical protein